MRESSVAGWRAGGCCQPSTRGGVRARGCGVRLCSPHDCACQAAWVRAWDPARWLVGRRGCIKSCCVKLHQSTACRRTQLCWTLVGCAGSLLQALLLQLRHQCRLRPLRAWRAGRGVLGCCLVSLQQPRPHVATALQFVGVVSCAPRVSAPLCRLFAWHCTAGARRLQAAVAAGTARCCSTRMTAETLRGRQCCYNCVASAPAGGWCLR